MNIDAINDHSALNKRWKLVCILAWSIFSLFELCMAYDHFYSAEPLCPYSDEDFGSWYWYTNFGALGGLGIMWCVLIMKILQMGAVNRRIPLVVAFNIVSIATIATILTLFFNWGGMCIDALNVASPGAIWAEWIVTGPMLIFITVTIVDRPSLSKTDCFMMVTFGICLVAGFLINTVKSYGWGLTWLFISCATYIPLLYLPFYGYRFQPEELEMVMTVDQQMESFAARYAKRQNLSIWLTIILPLYTVNYIAAMFGFIDYAFTIAVYQVLSVLTKGLFSATTMDIHLDLLIDTERALVAEKRANDARRAFMKYIFHEVRTPLNSLTMGIDLLSLSKNMNESDAESIQMMRGASEFMSDTLNDVLSIQKIEEGKLVLEIIPFKVRFILNKIVSTLRGSMSQKKISCTVVVTDDVPSSVRGDSNQIQHIISNLISNAIKFSPENGVLKITSTTKPLSYGDPDIINIMFTITDEGPGISISDQDKIFENFVQIRPGILQQGQGSGLGLSFCKQMVAAMKGDIRVVSDEGKGSTFVVEIPLLAHCTSPESLIPDTKYDDASNMDSINAPLLNKVSNGIFKSSSVAVDLGILVVDDSKSNRRMMSMLLKRKGMKLVDSVKNGKEAADTILEDATAKYKIILMDNLMPVMNGLDATKLIRKNGYQYIIVGVTGNVMADEMQEYLNCGADLVLSKPLKATSLDKLFHLLKVSGSFSKPGMTIMESSDVMEWVTV